MNKWLFGIVFLIMSVFVIMTGFSWQSGVHAREDSSNIKLEVETHCAAQRERELNLISRLDDIRSDIKDLKKDIAEINRNNSIRK